MKRRFLGLLVLAAFLGSVLYYLNFLRESRRPVSLALAVANQSSLVAKDLGGSELTKRFLTGRILSGTDYGNADLTIHVVWSNGSGTLFEWAQTGMQGWHICSLVLVTEKPEREITIVSDGRTHCERE
jgi:hypothetical protein